MKVISANEPEVRDGRKTPFFRLLRRGHLPLHSEVVALPVHFEAIPASRGDDGEEEQEEEEGEEERGQELSLRTWWSNQKTLARKF